MWIVLFILIGGLWAAFLLPSFFDQRGETPKSSTADFARTKRILATVSATSPDGEDYVRRHTQARRTRVLIGLLLAAGVTLAIATVTGSVEWLWASIAVDVAIAAYVTVLLSLRRQRMTPSAAVVRIGQPQAPAVSAVPEPAFEESQTVRVIAG